MRHTAILFFTILLTSCATLERSANRHLKLAERHIAKAKMKGAVIKESVSEEIDTAEVSEAAVEKEFFAGEIDTVYLQSNCDSLKSGNPEVKSAAMANIQEEVCPDVEETMVLQIPVTVNDSTYTITVNAAVSAHGGKLYVGLQNDAISIKYVSKTVSREISPDKTAHWQKYLIGFVAGVVLLLVLLTFKKR